MKCVTGAKLVGKYPSGPKQVKEAHSGMSGHAAFGKISWAEFGIAIGYLPVGPKVGGRSGIGEVDMKLVVGAVGVDEVS